MLVNIIFGINAAFASESMLPVYEQAVKFADAVWRPMPNSIDVTYYLTQQDKTISEETQFLLYKNIFDRSYGMDEYLNSKMLERKNNDIKINVDRDMAKQRQGGEKVKFRVRCNDMSYRVDRVYGNPKMVMSSDIDGVGSTSFEAGKMLDSDTDFEETFIETPASGGGYELYEYYSGRKLAIIRIIQSANSAINDKEIVKIMNNPCSLILQKALGVQSSVDSTVNYKKSDLKIKQLCSGSLKGLSVTIKNCEKEPDLKDAIEISMRNDKDSVFVTALMICAKDDYSKVYSFQMPAPAFGTTPIFTKTFENYDSQGIARNITETQYDNNGDVMLKKLYVIESIQIDKPIPKEVFEFNPPHDYEIIDYRLTKSERDNAEIDSLKKRLNDKSSNTGRRLEALVLLKEKLKNDPDQLREVAEAMLEDENNNIKRASEKILRDVVEATN